MGSSLGICDGLGQTNTLCFRVDSSNHIHCLLVDEYHHINLVTDSFQMASERESSGSSSSDSSSSSSEGTSESTTDESKKETKN